MDYKIYFLKEKRILRKHLTWKSTMLCTKIEWSSGGSQVDVHIVRGHPSPLLNCQSRKRLNSFLHQSLGASW